MTNSTFVYETYIATTQEKLWEALTNSDMIKKYWFDLEVRTDWQVGSIVSFLDKNGKTTDLGKVIINEPFHLLSYTFQWMEDKTTRERPTKVSFELKPVNSIVKLTLKHLDLLPTDFVEGNDGFKGYNNGWPMILSNLKSLLETGKTLTLD